MSLNKNRLASTAATIGAISYPVWTGSIWHLRVNFGYCLKHPTDCNQDFMDVLLGAAIPAALVDFGPRLLAAWLRWVREEDTGIPTRGPRQLLAYPEILLVSCRPLLSRIFIEGMSP